MFRKLTLAALTTLGLALPLGLAAPVQANEPYGYHHHHHSYEVMYRRHHGWHCYGTYRSRYDADHAAHHLRHEGYDVRIEVC